MAHYNRLPQFEDVEIQWAPVDDDCGGRGKIQAITISKEMLPDGSVVRRKETLLSNGKTVVEERVVSGGPLHAGIRLLPVTPAIFGPAPKKSSSRTILPFHDRCPSTSSAISVEDDFSIKTNKGQHALYLCAGCVLIFLFFIQIVLWYLLRTGKDLDDVWDVIFRQQGEPS